jgi:hypothetical protein
VEDEEHLKLMQSLVIDKLQEDNKINNKEKGEDQWRTGQARSGGSTRVRYTLPFYALQAANNMLQQPA